MAAPPWYRWFPADFARDTRHLSMMERGAYRDLLDAYYQARGKLRSDMAGLFRLCGAVLPDEQVAVRQVVHEFFKEGEPGHLRNERADAELAEQAAFLESKVMAGKLGAAIRWGDSTPNGTPNGSAIAQPLAQPSVCQWQNDSHTHTHTHKQNTKTLRVASDTAFGRFWETWPSSKRKVARHKCETTWLSKNLEVCSAQIIAHVEAMKESEQWRGGFEPAPLTYLNQRRWEDGEPPKPERRLAV